MPLTPSSGRRPTVPLCEIAEAKVNLFLEVLGRRGDGYHELASLAAFAAVGDRLELVPGEALSLAVDGPFAPALGRDNVVLHAVERLERLRPGLRAGAFRLYKALPVAAGLGGGSADAGAALRLLLRANSMTLAPREAGRLCADLGADVHACFASRACLMRGIGEKVFPAPALPHVPAVLANPGKRVATPEAYRALAAPPLDARRRPAVATPPGPFADVVALAAFLEPLGNDLQAPAIRLAPRIRDVLATLAQAPGCLLARVSGSGATCFALFASDGEAETAARRITNAKPGWWTVATTLH